MESCIWIEFGFIFIWKLTAVAIHLTPVRFYLQLGLYKGSAIQKLYRLVKTLHHSHSSSLCSLFLFIFDEPTLLSFSQFLCNLTMRNEALEKQFIASLFVFFFNSEKKYCLCGCFVFAVWKIWWVKRERKWWESKKKGVLMEISGTCIAACKIVNTGAV